MPHGWVHGLQGLLDCLTVLPAVLSRAGQAAVIASSCFPDAHALPGLAHLSSPETAAVMWCEETRTLSLCNSLGVTHQYVARFQVQLWEPQCSGQVVVVV